MIADLPVELLNHIVTYLPTAQAAAHFSTCNRALKRYFDDDGAGTATEPIMSTATLENGTTTTTSMLANGNNTTDQALLKMSGASTPPIPGMAGMPTGIADDFGTDPYASANYEVFDPLNWMLDGTVDFPFNFSSNPTMDTLNGLAADL